MPSRLLGRTFERMWTSARWKRCTTIRLPEARRAARRFAPAFFSRSLDSTWYRCWIWRRNQPLSLGDWPRASWNLRRTCAQHPASTTEGECRRTNAG